MKYLDVREELEIIGVDEVQTCFQKKKVMRPFIKLIKYRAKGEMYRKKITQQQQ